MSSQYINQNQPQYQISGRMKDLVLDGTVDVTGTMSGTNQILSGSQTIGGGLKVGTSITHDNIPAANIVQATSITTAIDATAVANPFNFNVSTFTATLSAGSHTTFFLNMPAGRLNSLGFASVSAYYYSGVVGTAGIPILSIVTQEADRVTLLLKNEHGSNALNGNIHFRFKYELGEN